MIPVRRARVLPLPSFRFRLAADTLGFGYDLPTAGRSRDFHPLERALAGRTRKKRAADGRSAALGHYCLYVFLYDPIHVSHVIGHVIDPLPEFFKAIHGRDPFGQSFPLFLVTARLLTFRFQNEGFPII